MSVVHEAVYENGVLKPDQPLPLSDKQRVRITLQPVVNDRDAPGVRRKLAENLVRQVEQALPFVGDVSLATQLHLLQTDLGESHDLLRPHPSERAYLAIITLAESALICQTWKQLTRPHLEALREALRLGCAPRLVGPDAYEQAQEYLSAAGVEVTPRVDLGSLSAEDLMDDQND